MSISTHRLKKNFNRAAADYDAHAAFQTQQTRRLFAHAMAPLSPNARILDLGCGTGQFARIAAESRLDWCITGIDIAEGMCRVARTHSTTIVNADATALPFADASFDAMISSLCMQWVEDKPRAFAEIHRVLKPGGTALIITLAEETLKELRAACTTLQTPLNLLTLTTCADYIADAKRAGFALTHTETTPEIHHYASAKALLHSMRSIGASDATNPHARKMVRPKAIMQLLTYYDAQYRDSLGIFATWHPMLLHLKKVS